MAGYVYPKMSLSWWKLRWSFVVRLFRKTLQLLFCCEAPEMFSGPRNLTQLPIRREGESTMTEFSFLGELILLLWLSFWTTKHPEVPPVLNLLLCFFHTCHYPVITMFSIYSVKFVLWGKELPHILCSCIHPQYSLPPTPTYHIWCHVSAILTQMVWRTC